MEEVTRRCPEGYFVQRFKAPLKRVMSDGVCHFKPLKGKVVYCQLINSPNFAKHRGYVLDMGVPVSRYVPPSSAMVATMTSTTSTTPSSSMSVTTTGTCIDLTQDEPVFETLTQQAIRSSHNPEVSGLWEDYFIDDSVGAGGGGGGAGGFFAEEEN
jgi:hypothetical protein